MKRLLAITLILLLVGCITDDVSEDAAPGADASLSTGVEALPLEGSGEYELIGVREHEGNTHVMINLPYEENVEDPFSAAWATVVYEYAETATGDLVIDTDYVYEPVARLVVPSAQAKAFMAGELTADELFAVTRLEDPDPIVRKWEFPSLVELSEGEVEAIEVQPAKDQPPAVEAPEEDAETEAPIRTTEYKDDTFNYLLEIPSDWSVESITPTVLHITPNDNNDVLLSIIIYEKSLGFSGYREVEELVCTPFEYYQDASNTAGSPTMPFSLAQTHFYATYTDDVYGDNSHVALGTADYKEYNVLAEDVNNVYVITYRALQSDFDSYESEAMAIIKSFSL